ncbi:MAG: NUDIX hydrolase [Chloroflexi bacterium]|nr:NUDIX hydrolase [Chloroflexota bacterium]
MQTFKTLSRKKILDEGKFLVVENHEVQTPAGHIIPNWSWVITPDYINVIENPCYESEDKKFLLFRQSKYAFDGQLSLATVGGYLEPNEDPLAAAKRELREEMGYGSKEWINFGTHRVDANRGAGNGTLFLALNAYHVGGTITDDLEPQELLTMTQEEVEAALLNGEFKCLAWAALVAMALLYLKK